MCGESSGSKGGCPHGATIAGVAVSHILVTPGREGDHPQTRKKRRIPGHRGGSKHASEALRSPGGP